MTDEQKPVCDVRIGWVLGGCRDRWRDEVRYVAVGIPAHEVGSLMGPMARSLVFEQEASKQFRAKARLNLQ